MSIPRAQVRNRERGFTLIELMIVVAIIGILAAVAVPNFVSYRNKSRVSAAVSTSEGIRAALAAYAADSAGNGYPAAIASYAALTVLVNANGGTLKNTATLMGIDIGATAYTATDSDGDGVIDSYSLTISVTGVPGTSVGHSLTVTPSGIDKNT